MFTIKRNPCSRSTGTLRPSGRRPSLARWCHVPRPLGGRRGSVAPDDYKAQGVLFLPPEAHFSELLTLPDSANLNRSLDEAMEAIERANPELADTLPQNYALIPEATLRDLLKLLAPLDLLGRAAARPTKSRKLSTMCPV